MPFTTEIGKTSLYARLCPFPGDSGEQTREALAAQFREQFGEVPIGGMDTYSCIPLALEPEQLHYLGRFVKVLDKALCKIAEHYFRDERIRSIYGLDPFLESVLAMAEGQAFRSGACRPDFLQTSEGTFKICEIGARFPLNGWMISYYLNRFSSKLPGYKYTKTVPLPGLDDIPERFVSFFDTGKVLAVLMDDEKGSEIHWMLHEMRQRGLDSLIARPQDLEFGNGSIQYKGKELTQFVLEMDREELRKFRPEVLKQMIRTSTYINDVRTLILLHDKRVLAVLYNRAIMRDYLSEEEYSLLMPFLIPSYSLSDPKVRIRITEDAGDWILKRSSGGRGVDMYVRNECTDAFWRQTVETRWNEYMVQTFVPQRHYRMQDRIIQVVGVLLCFNGHFFGTGIYRGSAYSVVNVHQGRGIIFPGAVFNSV